MSKIFKDSISIQQLSNFQIFYFSALLVLSSKLWSGFLYRAKVAWIYQKYSGKNLVPSIFGVFFKGFVIFWRLNLVTTLYCLQFWFLTISWRNLKKLVKMNLSRNVISYNVPNSSHLSSCKTCVELSNQETKLRQHNLSVHHSCLECNLRFENHWKTARHLQEVHNIQARCPFGCDFLIFAPDIKLHMKYKHNLSDRNNGECVYCQREFTMVNLLHHYIVK